MAETPKAQPSAFRQDLLRGVRWGTILLIAMLLGITAYRVLSSSPAVASQPKVAEELAPAPEVTPASNTAIQVGDAVLKGPDAPVAPEAPARAPKVRQSAAKTPPKLIEPPERLYAPRFPSSSVAPPRPTQNAFVAGPLPEPAPAPAPAPVVELSVPTTMPAAAAGTTPEAVDNTKQGNRAVRAVRSVGRIFRFGRKDSESTDSKKDASPAKK
jgi:hypothetical protein